MKKSPLNERRFAMAEYVNGTKELPTIIEKDKPQVKEVYEEIKPSMDNQIIESVSYEKVVS